MKADRPTLPSGARGWAAFPGSGPTMQEDDDASSDEEMSLPASGTSASNKNASGDVCNSGGNLSGPNGVVQNDGGEGSCIEVKFSWLCFTVDVFGSVVYWEVESEPVELCPC